MGRGRLSDRNAIDRVRDRACLVGVLVIVLGRVSQETQSKGVWDRTRENKRGRGRVTTEVFSKELLKAKRLFLCFVTHL